MTAPETRLGLEGMRDKKQLDKQEHRKSQKQVTNDHSFGGRRWSRDDFCVLNPVMRKQIQIVRGINGEGKTKIVTQKELLEDNLRV